MARKKQPKQPRSAAEIARSTGSPVALAAYVRSGAGRHGGSERQQHRRERQQMRRDLRSGGEY